MLLESGVTNGPLAVTEFPTAVCGSRAAAECRRPPRAGHADRERGRLHARDADRESRDAVAEGAPKPEATLTFAAVSDPLRKIAAWLPVLDEFLEDVPALRSFIDAQLRRGCASGGTKSSTGRRRAAPDRDSDGAGHRHAPQGTATALDALALAMAQVQTASGFAADGFVLNGTDWGQLRLVKDVNGNYLGGNLFGPPTPPVLWSLPVVPTSKIAAGTALVGNFRVAAQLFTKAASWSRFEQSIRTTS